MRTWHLAAATAALIALAIWPTIWSSTRASLVDAELRHHVVTEEDEVDLADLATRVAALETTVASLEATVAAWQSEDGTTQLTAETAPTPTPISLAPLSCGRPFASWGAATADGVSVQLLEIAPGSDVDLVIEGADVYVLDLAVDNRRADGLTLALDDFVLLDCNDEPHAALPDGFQPAIAPGELASGDSARGWLTFTLPPGSQPAGFVYRIQTPGLTGGEVSCPLVDRSAPPAPLGAGGGGAGCSARGGSAG